RARASSWHAWLRRAATRPRPAAWRARRWRSSKPPVRSATRPALARSGKRTRETDRPRTLDAPRRVRPRARGHDPDPVGPGLAVQNLGAGAGKGEINKTD